MKKSTLWFSALFFGGYLAVQLGWQFRCLLWNQNCTMAWTMYSGRERAAASVLWRDGSESTVDQLKKEGKVTILGAKIDRERFWPSYLCGHLAGAAAIRIERPYGGGQIVMGCEDLR